MSTYQMETGKSTAMWKEIFTLFSCMYVPYNHLLVATCNFPTRLTLYLLKVVFLSYIQNRLVLLTGIITVDN